MDNVKEKDFQKYHKYFNNVLAKIIYNLINKKVKLSSVIKNEKKFLESNYNELIKFLEITHYRESNQNIINEKIESFLYENNNLKNHINNYEKENISQDNCVKEMIIYVKIELRNILTSIFDYTKSEESLLKYYDNTSELIVIKENFDIDYLYILDDLDKKYKIKLVVYLCDNKWKISKRFQKRIIKRIIPGEKDIIKEQEFYIIELSDEIINKEYLLDNALEICNNEIKTYNTYYSKAVRYIKYKASEEYNQNMIVFGMGIFLGLTLMDNKLLMK